MKKAFSLIELLISLIIISLITAAFAPIITKKVSGSILSVTNNFTNNNNNNNSSEDDNKKDDEYVDPSCLSGPNEECCAKLNSQYVSKKNTPGYTGVDLCVMKYNAGDDKFILFDDYYHLKYGELGVQMLNAKGGVPCGNSGYCCYRGDTAGSASANYSYSGQGRTVCQSAAAEIICKNWAHYGSKKGSWRLPTQSELIAFSNAIKQDTASKAVFTKYLDYEGLQLCDQGANNKGANQCSNVTNCPGTLNNYCIPSAIWGQGKNSYWLQAGNFASQYSNQEYAKSVRCVSEAPGRVIGKEEERTPTEGEPKSQADCDPYDALFIDASKTGTKNICMTKYNPGEGNTKFDFGDAGVQLSKGGQSCTSKGGCCWQTNTSSSKSGSYSYSGQNRTVCTYQAAQSLCDNYAPKGAPASGKWRLPSTSELVNLTKYIAAGSINSPYMSKYLDTQGLQLCDQGTGAYGANQCANYQNCPGAYNTYCIPSAIWAEGKNSYWMNLGVFQAQYNGIDYAKSTRCVTDNITYNPPESAKVTGYEPTKEDCEEFDAIFIERKYTGTKNLCMTKYNPGEGTTKFDFGDAGVQLSKGGQSCAAGGNCCWQTSTGANANGNYSYSGQGRTVCRYDAAQKLCDNYVPNTSYGKNWRLATGSEMEHIAIYISASGHLSPFLSKYLNDTGLQLCDQSTSAQGANQCSNVQNCPGAFNTYCIPSAVWAEGKNSYWLNNGTFEVQYSNIDYAKSVRCVSDSPKKPAADQTDPSGDEPRNQTDCDQYNAIFISKEYTGSKNLCMTKTNFADIQGGVVIGANTVEDYEKIGVTVVDAAKSCAKGDDCCWRGNTAGSTAGTYNYAGFGRTVCRSGAAKKLCSNYKLGGSSTSWRLLTPSEANVLAPFISASGHLSPFLSKYLNDTGLQLCDQSTSAQGANQCSNVQNCPGAFNAYCIPSAIWADNTRSYWLSNGTFSEQYSGTEYAKSVRCVTDRVKR